MLRLPLCILYEAGLRRWLSVERLEQRGPLERLDPTRLAYDLQSACGLQGG